MTIARMGAAAALATALAAAGVAAAGESPDPTATTTLTTTATMTASTTATVPETTYGVGNAGTVTVLRSDDGLQITAAAPAAGWTVDVERTEGVEVEAVFTSETVELRFHAELEDGTVRTEVRSAATTAAPTTTPVDDDGTDADDSDDSAQEETVDEVAQGTEWASTHVPDHVDLTSRPASLRASATAFAHTDRGGDVDLEITREDGEVTVRAGGSLRRGHDD